MQKIMRNGKTARDRKSGAAVRNMNNKQARADWQNTSGAVNFAGMTTAHFPYATCNGKRNRALKIHSKVI